MQNAALEPVEMVKSLAPLPMSLENVAHLSIDVQVRQWKARPTFLQTKWLRLALVHVTQRQQKCKSYV